MFKRVKKYIQKAKAQFMEGYEKGKAKARSANDELANLSANLRSIEAYPVYTDPVLQERLDTFVLMYPIARKEMEVCFQETMKRGAGIIKIIPHETFHEVQMHLHWGNMKTASMLIEQTLRELGHEDLLALRAASMERLDQIIRQRDPDLADAYLKFNTSDRTGGEA